MTLADSEGLWATLGKMHLEGDLEREPLRLHGGEHSAQSANFTMKAKRRGMVLGVCAICLFAVAELVKQPKGSISLMDPDLRVSQQAWNRVFHCLLLTCTYSFPL
jgi:hypothetical protein